MTTHPPAKELRDRRLKGISPKEGVRGRGRARASQRECPSRRVSVERQQPRLSSTSHPGSRHGNRPGWSSALLPASTLPAFPESEKSKVKVRKSAKKKKEERDGSLFGRAKRKKRKEKAVQRVGARDRLAPSIAPGPNLGGGRCFGVVGLR